MRINIASFGGRTHMLDTARELEKYGHEVRFYSFVTDRRAQQFGLKKKCNRSLFFFAIPYLVWMKLFGFGGWGTYLYFRLCDWFIAYYMEPCDVFIGQSPMHNYSIRYAKRKYGAKTILERGTSHVLSFIENQKDIPNFHPFPSVQLKYDLEGYNYADYISVGAEHVRDSFIANGFGKDKIFLNNYGFDEAQFHPTSCTNEFDIIMVGAWSYRKGCDRLQEAIRLNRYRMLHVGSKTDLDIDKSIKEITDVGVQPQMSLVRYYSKAKIFVLPSREEGLALVLLQAVACGLPIVCSAHSGGRDIRKFVDKPEFIIETKNDSVSELCDCIERALLIAKDNSGIRNYAGEGFSEVSFGGYGRRYNNFLNSIS